MALLYEEAKLYPLLYDKQMKRYREKDLVSNAWNAGAKDLEFIENKKSHFDQVSVSKLLGD